MSKTPITDAILATSISTIAGGDPVSCEILKQRLIPIGGPILISIEHNLKRILSASEIKKHLANEDRYHVLLSAVLHSVAFEVEAAGREKAVSELILKRVEKTLEMVPKPPNPISNPPNPSEKRRKKA